MHFFQNMSTCKRYGSAVTIGNKMIKVEIDGFDPAMFIVNNTKALIRTHDTAEVLSSMLGFRNTKEWIIKANPEQKARSMIAFVDKYAGEVVAMPFSAMITHAMRYKADLHLAWGNGIAQELSRLASKNPILEEIPLEDFVRRASPSAHSNCLHPHASHFIEDTWKSIYSEIKQRLHI